MISFFKEKLKIKRLTAKNRRNPSTFWQSKDSVPSLDESIVPLE
jgi:hypothetical protein